MILLRHPRPSSTSESQTSLGNLSPNWYSMRDWPGSREAPGLNLASALCSLGHLWQIATPPFSSSAPRPPVCNLGMMIILSHPSSVTFKDGNKLLYVRCFVCLKHYRKAKWCWCYYYLYIPLFLQGVLRVAYMVLLPLYNPHNNPVR